MVVYTDPRTKGFGPGRPGPNSRRCPCGKRINGLVHDRCHYCRSVPPRVCGDCEAPIGRRKHYCDACLERHKRETVDRLKIKRWDKEASKPTPAQVAAPSWKPKPVSRPPVLSGDDLFCECGGMRIIDDDYRIVCIGCGKDTWELANRRREIESLLAAD